MVIPSILMGKFSFMTLKGLTTIGKGSLDLALESFTEFNTKVNAFKKKMMEKLSGKNSRFKWKGLKAYLKRPSDLDVKKVDVNNGFEDSQSPPLVNVLTSINPQKSSTDIQSRDEIAKKLNTFQPLKTVSQDSPSNIIRNDFRNTQDNVKSTERMPKWSQELRESIKSTGEFEEYHPKREMTIKEMLTEANLYGNDRIGVLVNGRRVDNENFVITPEDGIMILPILRGNAPNADPKVISRLEYR